MFFESLSRAQEGIFLASESGDRYLWDLLI